MQKQWPAPGKFNVGPLEGELAVTTPLHLQADTHAEIISSAAHCNVSIVLRKPIKTNCLYN